MGSGQKQVHLVRFGAKNRYSGVHSTITSKTYPTSPAISQKRIVPVFGRIKPR